MSVGHLPVAGGLMDQSYWFRRACQILSDEYAKNRETIESMRKSK